MCTPRTLRPSLRPLYCLAAGLLSVPLASRAADARPTLIEGVVRSAVSRWTDDGSRIVTEAVVATATGEVTVSQLGGTVDGLTMRTFPGPPILAPGMAVALDAHHANDLSAREWLVVDEVQVTGGFEFVRTGPTKGGKSLYWKSGCVEILPDSAGTSALPGTTEATIIHNVVTEWNNTVASCSYMNLVELAPQAHEVGRDFVNVIKFRDTSWCRPAIKNDPERCYSAAAAGLTTVVYVDDATNARDGEIVDADVEINGVNFAISANDQSNGPPRCKSDLANTLTHEIGHLLGLEHTCLAGGDPPRVDDAGQSVPACAGLPSNSPILETTMYNFQECGEVKKATLSMDEKTALCTTYPLAQDPGTCGGVGDPSEGCCSTQRDVPSTLLLSLVTGLLIWSRGGARRRRTKR